MGCEKKICSTLGFEPRPSRSLSTCSTNWALCMVLDIESVWSTHFYVYWKKYIKKSMVYNFSALNPFLWYGKELESPLVVATSCSVPFSFQSLSSIPPYIQAAPWLHHSRESFTTCGKVQLKSWNNSYHSIV